MIFTQIRNSLNLANVTDPVVVSNVNEGISNVSRDNDGCLSLAETSRQNGET